ncbi:MAG: hypothetical protein ACLR8U_10725 [Oscillospiraceae bacterium]
MVLYKEPVAEIRKFVDEQGIKTTIMYDMAHVLGLIGDHFQKPFEEGAEIVTGSTHKTCLRRAARCHRRQLQARGPPSGACGRPSKRVPSRAASRTTISARSLAS